MITISGLTAEQVDLLDIMWGLQDIHDYDNWKNSLSESTQNTVCCLEELVMIETLEQELHSVATAKALLKKFAL
jgi:hypothetical protein